MNSHTAAHRLSLTIAHPVAHPVPRTARRAEAAARIPVTVSPRASWMERLAAWAEKQPMHHRIGSYQRFR